MKHVLSIDLEDYFCDLPFSQWSNFEQRVEKNTYIILDLLEKHNANATFFTLGYIAEKHPELIEQIVSRGHEIASHGYSHLDIRKLNEKSFEKDLEDSLKTLQSVSKEKILGFRAPFFSINKSNFWALKIIKKYLKYDSSIFPAKTPLYGIPDAPREIYRMSTDNPLSKNTDSDFFELPLATLRMPLYGNLPIAGGFHMRFLPLWLIEYGLRKFDKKNLSTVFYLHPKDLDKDMPHLKNYSWHYYWGLDKALSKFEHILKIFKFTSVREKLSL